MKIRIRLRLNTLISVGVIMLIMLSMVWSFLEIDRANRNKNLVEEIQNAAFERIVLRDEYLLYREERAGIQWRAKSKILRGLIETASKRFAATKDKALLKDAREDFDATLSGFSTILEKYEREKRSVGIKLAFDEADSRLIGQVFLKTYSLKDSISRLYASMEMELVTTRNRGFILSFFFVLCGGVAIVFNSIVTGRIVAKGVTKLHEGVGIIGSGNLDYRIDAEGDDELAALARASNDMAARLKESYTSMASLQQEIIERQRAEAALRERKEFTENLIASMQDGFSVLDSHGVQIDVNPAFCQMTGFSREELIGVGTPHRYWPPEAYEEIEKAFQKTLRGDFGDVELTFMRKNGERFPVIVSPSWVKDKQGNVTSYFATVKDITERKRAEEERERLLADLEAKNKEMEAFVYTISHDLKAPLVSLNGFSGALQKEYESQLGEEGRHYLERIQTNVAHMEALISSLLELSRIGQVVGAIEEIDAAAMLREIRDRLAVRLKEAGTEFVVQEPLPTVLADRGRIHQVFINLIDNAVKFRSVERALRIEVGCRQESGFYRFHVADNGIGIAPQAHEQIFNPFRKLHPEIEGIGIGLALVKKIVEHHGGRVWVESPSACLKAGDEGAGATFYFTLPIERGV